MIVSLYRRICTYNELMNRSHNHISWCRGVVGDSERGKRCRKRINTDAPPQNLSPSVKNVLGTSKHGYIFTARLNTGHMSHITTITQDSMVWRIQYIILQLFNTFIKLYIFLSIVVSSLAYILSSCHSIQQEICYDSRFSIFGIDTFSASLMFITRLP